jgi:20S proteasome alpha/beta subunit
MTLQIGMMGQDGVILAGDSRINAKPIPGADAPWMSYEGQKIHISKSGRIAVSCAHDLQNGSHVAEAIFAKMTRGDYPGCEREIEQLGAATAQGRNVQCIVVFTDPLPCIYLYTYAGVDDSQHNDCQRIISCVPSGDTQNPAVFLGMSYYKQLPVEQLKRLAACMVVAGGNLNSAIIGGFEMVLCTKDGCVRVDEASTKELQRPAHAKLHAIGELIMSEHP